jgi:hypothetical protein
MLSVTVWENRRNGKTHHRVPGWEAAGFAQRSRVAIEKGVVVAAVHGAIGRPFRLAIALVTIISIVSSTTASPASRLVACP